MKKAEIIFPYDKWLSDKDKILNIANEHCKFYMYAHHHIYKDVSTFEHIHLGMWFNTDYAIENIAKWFNLLPNSIQKIHGQETAYALYIGLHYNQSDKEPLTAETSEFVHSQGKTLDSFKKVADNHIKSDDLLDKIAIGELKEYEVWKLDPVWLRKNKLDVEKALSVYNKSVKSKGVDIVKNVMWIYGLAGKGKTTLAKYFCDKDNKDYYIASDSNPLDDYMGQPTLILDDISSTTLTGKAMLKLLDPYTTSSQGARYYNKMLSADTIIITSTVSPFTWWKSISDNHTDGNVHQLLRRLNYGIYNLSDTTMTIDMFDGQGNNNYHMCVKIPEDVLAKVNSTENDAKIRMSAVINHFGFDVVVEDISNGFNNASNDDLPFNV